MSQSADYVVGQVSGSLQTCSGGSGSLASLFSSTAPAVLFQPAPKPSPRSLEQLEASEVKGQTQQQQQQKKKKVLEKTAAEQRLEKRESALLQADQDEQGRDGAARKKTRRTKEAESLVERDSEFWVTKRRQEKQSKQEEEVKRKRTLFVGNLPNTCTKKMIRNLFKDSGPIESIRFRSVIREDPSMSRKVATITRKIHPKKQSINAYVVFKEEGGVTNALQRNGTEIQQDFHIRVDRVTHSTVHDHKRSVFVGNLSFEINELTFRRHFEECGAVEAVRLVRDQTSGLGKGFGYILYESVDSVQLALRLDGSQLEGRTLRVRRSVNKEKVLNKKGEGKRGKACRGAAPGRPKGGAGGNQQRAHKSSASFKGEMVDPNKRKRPKKKGKPKKKVNL